MQEHNSWGQFNNTTYLGRCTMERHDIFVKEDISRLQCKFIARAQLKGTLQGQEVSGQWHNARTQGMQAKVQLKG